MPLMKASASSSTATKSTAPVARALRTSVRDKLIELPAPGHSVPGGPPAEQALPVSPLNGAVPVAGAPPLTEYVQFGEPVGSRTLGVMVKGALKEVGLPSTTFAADTAGLAGRSACWVACAGETVGYGPGVTLGAGLPGAAAYRVVPLPGAASMESVSHTATIARAPAPRSFRNCDVRLSPLRRHQTL